MRFSPEQLRSALAVLDAKDASFKKLTEIAGLRPDRDLCGADLRRVDFGDDDFSGFDFAGTDLAGANLSRARGLREDMFVGIHDDATTRWPDGLRERIRGFDVEKAARALILGGRAPPRSWRPFIRKLDLSAPFEDWLENQNKADKPSEGIPLAFARTDLLAGLSALESLNLAYTKVGDIAPLAGLSALQSLDLTHTRVSDIAPLAGLSALQSLHLDNTQVSDIAPLAALRNCNIYWHEPPRAKSSRKRTPKKTKPAPPPPPASAGRS